MSVAAGKQQTSAAAPRVRFVAVPFLPAKQPALGVSSLLSVLRSQGIDGDVQYLNLEYGDHVGWDFYHNLVGQVPTSFLPGEMIFTRALWGEQAPSFAEYEARITAWFGLMNAGAGRRGAARGPLVQWWEQHADRIATAVEEAPQMISRWAGAVLEGSPRVLAFTSTFQQNVAALALAKEVRRRVPADEVAIVFGGANCEDEMGRAIADNFEFVDCVVSGEGEGVIVDLARKLFAGEQPPRFVPGVMVRDMNALPLPDFDDYFATISRTNFRHHVSLAVESSRGCWWGVKSHCTFCGLNGGTMAFRSKSAPRFAAELETLSDKYGTTRFAVTDNILDMGYLRTLFPELIKQARRYHLFYETKSNLRKEQVELLAAAGVSVLQPGIESFSTDILKLMAKGTTRLQNIQLLKWCQEMGVGVTWNLLYGFPHEDPREYQAMAELLPALFHLAPPTGCSKVRLDRFGPYWREPERYDLRDMRPYWSYDFALAGLPPTERARMAYFFEYEYGDGSNPYAYARPAAEQVAEWRRVASGPQRVKLELQRSGPTSCVVDTRPCGIDEVYPLTAAGQALLRALDGFRNRGSLGDAVRAQGVEIDDADCEALAEDFLARRFLVEEQGILLSLVVDPRERERVADRQVALRLDRMGLRWPEDFPDPQNQAVVRAAMLAMPPERSATAESS